MTGAEGFVGRQLCEFLVSKNIPILRGVRRKTYCEDSINMNFDDAELDFCETLNECSTVIHLAARVHVLREISSDPLYAFRETNVSGTIKLAIQALKSQVKRFIFISSIGVNGNETFGKPFRREDIPDPQSPYALSKHEAEVGLRRIFGNSAVELIIIRSPAIYGAGAPGNFAIIQKFITMGIPLPIASIQNKRSFLALENLVDLIYLCLKHDRAGNKTILASDGIDLSTPEIVSIVGKLIRRTPKLIRFPAKVLETLFSITNRDELSKRLLGDLQIDADQTSNLLGWEPPFSPLSLL